MPSAWPEFSWWTDNNQAYTWHSTDLAHISLQLERIEKALDVISESLLRIALHLDNFKLERDH